MYLWGIPAHPQIPRAQIPSWCAAAVAQKRFHLFRELLGTFVVIVDDPQEHRITFVSDILGIRPMFIGRCQGRLVFGSDVWALQQAGLTTGECDYGAISTWLAYGFNCTGGSLFLDLRRLPPGAAVVIEDGRTTEIPYASFETDSAVRTVAEVGSDIHEIVSSSIKQLLGDHPSVSIPLSGGFDSRYLLALCLSIGVPVHRIVNVSFSEAESDVARRVAEILHVPVEVLPVNSSVWDIYDNVHHFMADGFPISKFVTYCVAERYPDMPMVNGFMGDSLVRGSNDTCAGRYEQEWSGSLVDAMQQKFLAVSTDLLRPSVARRIQARARGPLEDAARRGSRKVFGWGDLYLRQRHYISNNFLQHLGLAEALLPFYSWALMSYKATHDDRLFSKEVYRHIFRRHFPAIADVPHASDLPKRTHVVKSSRCTVGWARELLISLCRKNSLELFAKERCIPLMLFGASPLRSLNHRVAAIVEDAVLTCRRVLLLESRIKEAKLDFDWDGI